MLGIMNRAQMVCNGDLESADLKQYENWEIQMQLRMLSALTIILVRNCKVVSAIVKPYARSNLEVITDVYVKLHHT
jgi:hypothetical protein